MRLLQKIQQQTNKNNSKNNNGPLKKQLLKKISNAIVQTMPITCLHGLIAPPRKLTLSPDKDLR